MRLKRLFSSAKRESSDMPDCNIKPIDVCLTAVAEHGVPFDILSMALDEVQNVLIIGTRSGIVKIFGGEGIELSSPSLGASVEYLHSVPSQSVVVAATSKPSVAIVSLRDGAVYKEIPQENHVTSLDSDPAFPHVFIGNDEGDVSILNVERKDFSLYTFPKAAVDDTLGGDIVCCRPNPVNTGQGLVVTSTGVSIIIDFKTKKCVQRFQLIKLGACCAAWRPDGKQFCVADSKSNINVFSVDKSSPIACKQVVNDEDRFPVVNVAWTIDGNGQQLLVSGGGSTEDPDGIAVFAGEALDKLAFLPLSAGLVASLASKGSPWVNEPEPFQSIWTTTKDGKVTNLKLPSSTPYQSKPTLLGANLLQPAVLSVSATDVSDMTSNTLVCFESMDDDEAGLLDGGEPADCPQIVTAPPQTLLATTHTDGSVRIFDCQYLSMKPLMCPFHVDILAANDAAELAISRSAEIVDGQSAVITTSDGGMVIYGMSPGSASFTTRLLKVEIVASSSSQPQGSTGPMQHDQSVNEKLDSVEEEAFSGDQSQKTNELDSGADASECEAAEATAHANTDSNPLEAEDRQNHVEEGAVEEPTPQSDVQEPESEPSPSPAAVSDVEQWRTVHLAGECAEQGCVPLFALQHKGVRSYHYCAPAHRLAVSLNDGKLLIIDTLKGNIICDVPSLQELAVKQIGIEHFDSSPGPWTASAMTSCACPTKQGTCLVLFVGLSHGPVIAFEIMTGQVMTTMFAGAKNSVSKCVWIGTLTWDGKACDCSMSSALHPIPFEAEEGKGNVDIQSFPVASVLCVVSEKHVRLYKLPAHGSVYCGKTELLFPPISARFVKSRAEPDTEPTCLFMYDSAGRVSVLSLFHLKALTAADLEASTFSSMIDGATSEVFKSPVLNPSTLSVLPDGRMFANTAFSTIARLNLFNNGSPYTHAAFKPSGTTYTRTLQGRPKAQKGGLKSLFSAGPKEANFEQLFGDNSQSQREGSSVQGEASSAANAVVDAKNALLERGEKLSRLEQATQNMQKEADDFYETLRKHNEKEAKKKWYQI